MKNKRTFSTRGFSPLLILILFFIIIINPQSPAYWHHVYDYDDYSFIVYNVVGDSSALYADIEINQKGKLIKSTNLGRTWETIYDEWGAGYSWQWGPFKSLKGMQFPTSSRYMFLLYSHNDNNVPEGEYKAGTGIKRFNVQLGKVVDSIAIELEYGKAKNRDFVMYDSLNGLIYSSGILSITRDGWKSFTQSDVRNRGYNEDSSGYVGLCYGLTAPIMLSIDTVFFLGYHLIDIPPLSSFHLAFIGKGDTTFTFEPLGHGINIETTEDSTHFVTQESEIFYKRANNFAYINDSTWLYTAPGHRTGYGKCKTLEILKTVNRGQSYYQVCSLDVRTYGLIRVYFKDSLNGIAVGNGVTLETNDCGETWKVDTTVYDFDWTVFNQPSWNPRISYVDDMTFLTCWNTGIYKYEDSLGTGVKENIFMNNTLLYPNPIQAGKILNFKIPQLISGRAFIYDIYGNKVQDMNFFGNSIQLTNNISPGTYFLVIGNMDEKIVARTKFIVK